MDFTKMVSLSKPDVTTYTSGDMLHITRADGSLSEMSTNSLRAMFAPVKSTPKSLTADTAVFAQGTSNVLSALTTSLNANSIYLVTVTLHTDCPNAAAAGTTAITNDMFKNLMVLQLGSTVLNHTHVRLTRSDLSTTWTIPASFVVANTASTAADLSVYVKPAPAGGGVKVLTGSSMSVIELSGL